MSESNSPKESDFTSSNDNDEFYTNFWINRVLTWWSGFSLRTKLLAIATLVVITSFVLGWIILIVANPIT